MATHSYDQFIAACAGYPKPNPFASDWCITDVGEEHEYRLPPSINRAKSLPDADEWSRAIKCSLRSEEHTSELQSLRSATYASSCLKDNRDSKTRLHREARSVRWSQAGYDWKTKRKKP